MYDVKDSKMNVYNKNTRRDTPTRPIAWAVTVCVVIVKIRLVLESCVDLMTMNSSI